MAEVAGTDNAPQPKASAGSVAPTEYGDKVFGAIQWVLGALGAVAATALGKLAFDQLSNGDFGSWRWLLALASAAAFGVGVVALVSSVVATTTFSSVGDSWLRNAKEPDAKPKRLWRWLNQTFLGRDPYLAWAVASDIGDSKYLLPGADETQTSAPKLLRSFSERFAALVKAQYDSPDTFAADLNSVDRLRILTGARKTLLEVAKRARLQQVSRQIPSRFLLATILVMIGAVGFGLVTSQAKRVAAAEDRKAERVVVGDLLPKVPTSVRVLFPATMTDRPDQQKRLSVDGNTSCDLDSVDAVLIGISLPTGDPAPPSTHVMHVFTFASDTCKSVELWLPPERVILPPTPKTPAATKPADGASPSSSSSVPPAPGSG